MDRIKLIARITGGRLWLLSISLLILTLSAATYGVHVAPVRYVSLQAGTEPTALPPEDLRRWRQSSTGLTYAGEGAGTEARLAARRGREVAALQSALTVPAGAEGLRVELSLGAENLKPGAEPWQNARVQLLSFDRSGRYIWYWPRDVFSVSVDRPLGPVTAVLPLSKDIEAILVRVYNGADAGVLRFRPPRFVFLVERPVFAILRSGLVLMWLGFGLWAARAAARQSTAPVRAGTLLCVAALALVGALMPQPAYRDATGPVKSLSLLAADYLTGQKPLLSPPARPAPGRQAAPTEEVQVGGLAETETQASSDSRSSPPAASKPLRIHAPAPPDYPFSFKEVSHFGVFFLLGLVCFAAFPASTFAGRTLYLAGFALATESLQWFVVTRSSGFQDLAIDMAGLIVAGAVTATGAWIRAAVKAQNRDRARPGGRS